MLYLIEPNGPLKWDDIPTHMALEATKIHGVDLGRLPWQDSERLVTADTIRVALRFGIPCSRGIVIEPIHLIDLDRADALTKSLADVKQSQAALSANDDWMETLLPGWKETGQKLEASIDASTLKSIQEAEAKATELLGSPVSKTLLSHWRTFGGQDPDA